MNSTKHFILIMLIALVAILISGAGFASNNMSLEEHDFDSYFKMDVPKGISFEKTEGMPTKNINCTIDYRNSSKNINIVYTEAAGVKEDLMKYYEDFAKNNSNITLNTTNNTTVIHFKGENIIGEDNYHDMAIAGDDYKYVILQCDNESLMNSMAKSLKFN